MKHLTVRDVPADLAEALAAERRRCGVSLNKTIILLLRRGLGLGAGRATNGLERLAGTWTQDELEEFERATEIFETVDEELWK